MKKILCSLSGLLLTAAFAQADTIATWSFEAGQSSALSTATFAATGTSFATYGAISSDVGVGYATGLHVGTATVWSTPAGDANLAYPTSSHSLSANTFAAGDYFQFTVNPNLGSYTYSGVQLSWDQTGSNTGPKTFGLWYSADGTVFSQAGVDYTLAYNSWNATSVLGNHETADLTGATALNTAPTMYFRIVEDSPVTGGSINGGNVAAAGTDRVDNFTVMATVTPVPEPATLSLFGGFGLLAWSLIRRRQ